MALKIVTAEASSSNIEVRIYQRLNGSTTEEEPHLAELLDHFSIHGPNGDHTCLVMPVLGPRVQSLSESADPFKIRPDVVRKFAKQSLRAITRLHACNIAVGDVSTANMLMSLDQSYLTSTEQIYDSFGQPDGRESQTSQGFEKFRAHAPWKIYWPIDFLTKPECLLPDINIVDLGEAVVLGDDPISDPGFNAPYAAPELLFDKEKSYESDVWSLACCWYEMRSGKQLFPRDFLGQEDLGVIRRMRYACGPLPKVWENIMNVRVRGWSKANYNVMDKYEGDISLSGRVDDIGKWHRWFGLNDVEKLEAMRELHGKIGSGTPFDEEFAKQEIRDCLPPPPKALSSEERDDFLNLLTGMLKYDPKERITLEDVASHPWLNKTYAEDMDLSEPMYQKYTDGHEFLDDPTISYALLDAQRAARKAKEATESEVEDVAEAKAKEGVRVDAGADSGKEKKHEHKSGG